MTTEFLYTGFIFVPADQIDDANAFAISQGWGATFDPAIYSATGLEPGTFAGCQTLLNENARTSIINAASAISGSYFIADRVLQGTGRYKKYVDKLKESNATLNPNLIGSLWDFSKSLDVLGLTRIVPPQ